MQKPLDVLRNLLKEHESLTLARRLYPYQRVYARAVLGLEHGMTDTLEVVTALQAGPQESPIPSLPTPPNLGHDARAMWLRLLTGTLLSSLDAPRIGTLDLLDGGPLERRLTQAQHWATSLGRPLVYAVKDWATVSEIHALQPGVEVVTLEEAVLTLAARSKTRLRQLAQWSQSALVLEGLHTLDPRGFPALARLTAAAAEQGVPMAITGNFPHPLHEQLPGESSPAAFQFHPEHHDVADLIASLDDTTPTLILVPSRRAALELHAQFPTTLLTTRTKTVQHLRDESETSVRIQIATWGSASLQSRRYARIITARMPWPTLADAALATAQLDVFPITVWNVPAPLVTPQSITDDLLLAGHHPLDLASHQLYWQALQPFLQDTLDIARSTSELNFREISQKFRQLFQSGITVLVQQPGAEADVQRARRTGRLPISPYTARISHTSFTKAVEAGWIEEVDQALIWTGPYSRELGVNTA